MRFKFFLIILVSLTLLRAEKVENKDYYKELSENVNLFFRVYREINAKYVDSVDSDEFIKSGIDAMLDNLDPYTVMLEGDQKTHYDELSTGKYGGIGIYIGVSGDDKRLTVVSPIDDTPASKVGLRAGDRIMKINDESTDGFDTKDASERLRGKEGTKVILTIKRVGEKKLLDFEITREKITVINVPYSGIVDSNIGYIKVSQFAKSTVKDVKEKLNSLISQGAEGIILDLRFNPGGLLSAAVDMSNLFLDNGSEIVSTKGRDGKVISLYKTTKEPINKTIPLVVLINESSASASEIVSGSLQDYDRAVIIGKNSFGKGLVQQIYPLTKEKSVKITIAKYYTPSGRLIQKKDYFNHKKKNAMVDTLVYNTLYNKREVKSGVGVMPDIIINENILSPYVATLRMKNIFSDFCYEYMDKNSDFNFNGEINDKILDEFKTYVGTKEFDYTIKGEKEIDSLAVYSSKEKYSKEFTSLLDQLKNEIKKNKTDDFDENLGEIEKFLKIQFAVFKNGSKERYKISISDDPQVKKAVEVLKNRDEYNKILGYQDRS